MRKVNETHPRTKAYHKILESYDGSEPHPYPLYESVVNILIQEPLIEFKEVGKKVNRSKNWVTYVLNKPDVECRYRYLQRKVEKKIIKNGAVTKTMIIDGILAETVTNNPAIRLRAWELLGKTMALFTDRLQHVGLPKRIVIRTEKGVENLIPDQNDVNSYI